MGTCFSLEYVPNGLKPPVLTYFTLAIEGGGRLVLGLPCQTFHPYPLNTPLPQPYQVAPAPNPSLDSGLIYVSSCHSSLPSYYSPPK